MTRALSSSMRYPNPTARLLPLTSAGCCGVSACFSIVRNISSSLLSSPIASTKSTSRVATTCGAGCCCCSWSPSIGTGPPGSNCCCCSCCCRSCRGCCCPFCCCWLLLVVGIKRAVLGWCVRMRSTTSPLLTPWGFASTMVLPLMTSMGLLLSTSSK